jgi:hypothetical protein
MVGGWDVMYCVYVICTGLPIPALSFGQDGPKRRPQNLQIPPFFHKLASRDVIGWVIRLCFI